MIQRKIGLVHWHLTLRIVIHECCTVNSCHVIQVISPSLTHKYEILHEILNTTWNTIYMLRNITRFLPFPKSAITSSIYVTASSSYKLLQWWRRLRRQVIYIITPLPTTSCGIIMPNKGREWGRWLGTMFMSWHWACSDTAVITWLELPRFNVILLWSKVYGYTM